MLFPTIHNTQNAYGLSKNTVDRIIDKAWDTHEGRVSDLTDTELMEAIQDNHYIDRLFRYIFSCCAEACYDLGDNEKLALAREFRDKLRALGDEETTITLEGQDSTGNVATMTLYNNPEDYYYTYLQIGNREFRVHHDTLQSLKGEVFISPERKQQLAKDEEFRKLYQGVLDAANFVTFAKLAEIDHCMNQINRCGTNTGLRSLEQNAIALESTAQKARQDATELREAEEKRKLRKKTSKNIQRKRWHLEKSNGRHKKWSEKTREQTSGSEINQRPKIWGVLPSTRNILILTQNYSSGLSPTRTVAF